MAEFSNFDVISISDSDNPIIISVCSLYEILKAWIDKRIQLLISSEVLQEYQRVGEELLQRYAEIEIKPILKSFSKNTISISAPRLPHPVCVDPDDDKFIECAVAGNAELIISGDKHL